MLLVMLVMLVMSVVTGHSTSGGEKAVVCTPNTTNIWQPTQSAGRLTEQLAWSPSAGYYSGGYLQRLFSLSIEDVCDGWRDGDFILCAGDWCWQQLFQHCTGGAGEVTQYGCQRSTESCQTL